MALLSRAQVLGAVRVAKLLDRARHPDTPAPEAGTAELMARRAAARLPNGPAITYDGRLVLDREGDGHDEAGSTGL